MKVLKFGGSSVSTPERIREVARIALASGKREQTVVIVSAFQGVTNQLLECARLAASGDVAYEQLFEQLENRHRTTLAKLHGGRSEKATLQQTNQMLLELRDVLHGIYLLRDCPPRAQDLAGSFGERLSALIISSYLRRKHAAPFVDTRSEEHTSELQSHSFISYAVF